MDEDKIIEKLGDKPLQELLRTMGGWNISTKYYFYIFKSVQINQQKQKDVWMFKPQKTLISVTNYAAECIEQLHLNFCVLETSIDRDTWKFLKHGRYITIK